MNTLSAPKFHRARLLHTMLRVRNIDASMDFYIKRLGMRLLRRQDFAEQKFTLAFVGYDDEDQGSVIELTQNWDDRDYSLGDAFGHLAIAVEDVFAAVDTLRADGVRIIRPAGPLKGDQRETIAFCEDPDGYCIELIQRA